ncbi:kinase [Rossellomorea vietnamensis]|uniref:Kinase n=1 Tax=Rossellomorea vietnamensis TaxID=218284 RepID=A0ACD4CCT7_9BACI|nr:kinase [Rossellomorea vietnamensis]UXH46224.1 kinase [Rossellomorea vietnamensis]
MAIDQVMRTLFAHYTRRSSTNRPFIVGVDGLGGSGKTTLARKVQQAFMFAKCDAVILHMDDFIVEKSERYGTGYEEWYEYYALQWNVEQLRKELFQRLHGDFNSITLPFYESNTDSVVPRNIQIDGVKVVLIEGVFLQRKEWRNFFDFVIFLDCPPELRTERVIGRDTYLGDERARVEKYKRRYWLAEDHYLLHENPAGQADYIGRI